MMTPGVVYVGNIPHGFFEPQMKQFFSQFGTVTQLRLSRSIKVRKIWWKYCRGIILDWLIGVQGSPHLQKTERLDFSLREHEEEVRAWQGDFQQLHGDMIPQKCVVSSHHLKKKRIWSVTSPTSPGLFNANFSSISALLWREL